MSQSNIESALVTSDLLSHSSNYLDNMMWLHENAVIREKRLINEVSYVLQEVRYLQVSVGLSPARGFIPVVRLSSARNNISFTKLEWIQLSTNFKNILEERVKIKNAYKEQRSIQMPNGKKRKLNADNDDDNDDDDADGFELNKKKEIRLEQFDMTFDVKLSDRYIIIDSRNSRIVMEVSTFRRLEALAPTIDYRLSMFESLDFPAFYERVLKAEAEMEGDIVQNIQNLMLYPQNQSAIEPVHFENVHSMLDVLAHNCDKLKRDSAFTFIYKNVVENDLSPLSPPATVDASEEETTPVATVVENEQPKQDDDTDLLQLHDDDDSGFFDTE